MTDRELLEAAAKAAGIEVTAVVAEGIPHRFGAGYWNPLTDDGDALRLAVKLDMAVYPSDTRWTAEKNGWYFDESAYPDASVAVRRAIVRAAAEIEGAKP